MSADARALLGELLDARAAGAAERAAALLHDDVRYWDPAHGDVEGREAVAAVLAGAPGRLELETVVAAEASAVAELQVRDGGGEPYRSTEVYALRDGAVARLRAYFDPTPRPAA
jgi:ketosteroid isomerase-like protein